MKLCVILALLLVKHFFADFVLQSRYQLHNKGLYGHWGGILHAFIHAIGTMIVFIIFGDWRAAVLLGLVDGLVHYHVDWLKAQINQQYDLTVQHKGFWMVLGCDQLLHQLTYVGLVMYALMFRVI